MRVWESGFYPEYEFLRPRAYYYGSERDRLVFSVVRKQGSFSDETLSEVQWADPSEIRLMGALLLSRKPDWGQFFFESVYFRTIPIHVRYDVDLTHPEVRRALYSHARIFSKAPGSFFNIATQKDAFEPEWAEKLYDSISPQNRLLLRGISCLLRGGMLARRRTFMGDAALNAFVSLEALIYLIGRHLSGSKNIKTDDAFAYLENNFSGGKGLVNYFKKCYENRIKIVYPGNRFGDFLFPPLFADDFLDTQETLVEVYRDVILKLLASSKQQAF